MQLMTDPIPEDILQALWDETPFGKVELAASHPIGSAIRDILFLPIDENAVRTCHRSKGVKVSHLDSAIASCYTEKSCESLVDLEKALEKAKGALDSHCRYVQAVIGLYAISNKTGESGKGMARNEQTAFNQRICRRRKLARMLECLSFLPFFLPNFPMSEWIKIGAVHLPLLLDFLKAHGLTKKWLELCEKLAPELAPLPADFVAQNILKSSYNLIYPTGPEDATLANPLKRANTPNDASQSKRSQPSPSEATIGRPTSLDNMTSPGRAQTQRIRDKSSDLESDILPTPTATIGRSKTEPITSESSDEEANVSVTAGRSRKKTLTECSDKENHNMNTAGMHSVMASMRDLSR